MKVDGVQIEGVQGVRSVVFDHFIQHVKRVDVERPSLGEMVFMSLFNKDGANLIMFFLLEEIKEAVWDCDSFKRSGPNGSKLEFFKDFWDMLKVKLLNFFVEFHRNGKLTKGLNSTFIALIPKIENTQRLVDFWPISLVSSFYKILSKVFANML